MITPYQCTQCGSTDLKETDKNLLRCSYCGSLFKVVTPEPELMIRKGANVVFGKNAHVEIRGEVEIEDGAHVDVQGKVTLVDKNAQQELKLVEKGNRPA